MTEEAPTNRAQRRAARKAKPAKARAVKVVVKYHPDSGDYEVNGGGLALPQLFLLFKGVANEIAGELRKAMPSSPIALPTPRQVAELNSGDVTAGGIAIARS